jgi:glutamate:GABA antiporter
MRSKPTKFLGVFLLAMLNLSVMTSLRNLPIVSEYGFGAPFLYFVVALTFLFPSAMISAELASAWTQRGGIYIWVKEAFGPGWGFFAVWMQWIHNVTWFPAILSFAATALAYIIDPNLAENRVYLLSFILVGFWGFTIFNLFGLKTSSWFSALGVIAGTVIPGFLLIALGVIWVGMGRPIEIEFSWGALIPPIDNVQNLVFLAGLFLAFGGLEVSAAHVKEVASPQKTFPKAILIAALMSLLLYVAGALAIAFMVPREEISLVAGLMEAFAEFLNNFHLEWMMVPLSLMVIFGAVGELNAWIIGPVRALHATAGHGDLPPIFQKLNRNKVPANLLFFQGIIVTIASFAFLWMPTASSAFWILSAMAVQLYLVMYILMFLSAIKLRYTHPDIKRPYRVPGGKVGIWVTGLVGAVSSLGAFALGFLPPNQLQTGNAVFYEGFLFIGLALMSIIPVIIFQCKRPEWQVKHHDD